MKNLLIVDDHQLILDGLKLMLSENKLVEVKGEVRNGREALDFLEKNQIDIVIMDIEMPDMDGIEASKKIKENFPEVHVMILSMYSRPEMVRQLVNIGIDGFVKKDAGMIELFLGLEKLADGQTYFSQSFTQSLIESSKVKKPKVSLTNREKEVLQQLALGLKSKQIADKLFISTYTVDSHRKNLLSKFNVSNTTTLLKEASSFGIISL